MKSIEEKMGLSAAQSLLSWERGLKYGAGHAPGRPEKVAPLVGAWIEIFMRAFMPFGTAVAPLVGAWIEIVKRIAHKSFAMSLLSWERGLKSQRPHGLNCLCSVAPLVGAWIEISSNGIGLVALNVAPLVGAWIEIGVVCPLRQPIAVAPLVGAWIEISNRTLLRQQLPRRSSRGSVD